MSSVNMNPPQTYSRLFRPWDCNTRATPIQVQKHSAVIAENSLATRPLVKSEYAISMLDVSYNSRSSMMMKTDNTLFSSHESDRECASSGSSSCSKLSIFEDSFNSSGMQMETTTTPPISNAVVHPMVYGGNTYMYGPSVENHGSQLANHHSLPASAAFMPSHMMPPMSPTASTSELYYAAAAAAAANMLPNVPSTSSAAAAAAAAAYAIDPYALSLMEQEYARVMAEDAHLKAANARKQRPKKFKCPHCEVAFSNNGQLRGHIRIHTGERPFKCDVETCGKTFTRNEELTRHKRIHTGLRPFPCTLCGKKFGRRDHLKKHLKTHVPQERQQFGTTIYIPVYPYVYSY